MDDVLASIRRIVRTEKQAEDAEEVMASDEFRGGGSGRHGNAEPLVLTPEMRIDGPAAGARPTELAADMSEASGGNGAAMPDREALRHMLREILREELGGGPAEGAVREILREELDGGAAEGTVRGIIRDELTTGEVGRNVSQNVLRLIRSELAKAVETR